MPGDLWTMNLRLACGFPLHLHGLFFFHLIFSFRGYFIWHPCILFLLCYSPLFGAGMHSSSQLPTGFIMLLFTSASESLMRMLTKSRPATNLPTWECLSILCALTELYPFLWIFCQLSIHLKAELVNNLLMNLDLIFLHEVCTNSLIVTDLFLAWTFSRNTYCKQILECGLLANFINTHESNTVCDVMGCGNGAEMSHLPYMPSEYFKNSNKEAKRWQKHSS